ncbi:MAG: serine/threonine-protein kinase [Verrucomicrobiota bacterium]|nr:serine/threonine-protein kinase [Verrucomicrobiota bacterium]
MPDLPPGVVAEIVKCALERDSAEWPAYLEQACGPDAELRSEVESLLGFSEPAQGLIEQPAISMAAALFVEDMAFPPGTRFGSHEILSLIGAGGMGEVYLARDTELGRKVALKFIKAGVGSRNLLRHFRAEERILAAFNHPNIAQLYGAALTETGAPYFVMEYVDGARLDEFCDERKLDGRARLELFWKVCAAVSYAHRNLVIHRDLKPANIRVTSAGEPKLLDFGIAKLLADETAALPDQTITLAGMMTPAYASPEQVRKERMTTASDVYSLGVILYELLTGRKPYRLTSHSPAEISRAITEQSPARPSTAADGSAQSKSDTRNLKMLQGDLDNIVLMAMRKEPERRYPSVAQLAEDIRRYLAGLPVVARKDTVRYRASKFIRRNRVAVAAAVVVMLALLAGLVVALAQTAVARQQRDLARQERARAERINEFLQRMLSFSNQSVTSVSPIAQSKNVTVNEMLAQIAPQVTTELADQPEVRGQILRTIGSAYASQGLYDKAEENLRAALQTQVQLFGETSAEAAASMLELGVLSYRQQRLEEAASLLTKALTFYDGAGRTRTTGPNLVKAALAKDYLGVVTFYQGDKKKALSLLRDAYNIAENAPPQTFDSSITTFIKSDLGGVLIYCGELDQGEPLLAEAIGEYRSSSRPRWELGSSLLLMGIAQMHRGLLDAAEASLQEAEQLLRITLGDNNVYLSNTLNQAAWVLFRKGNVEGAENKAREALRINQSLSPAAPLGIADSQWILGEAAMKLAHPQVAEKCYREALQIYQQQPGNAISVVRLQLLLSQALFDQNNVLEAEKIARSAHETAMRELGEKNPLTSAAAEKINAISARHPADGPSSISR